MKFDWWSALLALALTGGIISILCLIASLFMASIEGVIVSILTGAACFVLAMGLLGGL